MQGQFPRFNLFLPFRIVYSMDSQLCFKKTLGLSLIKLFFLVFIPFLFSFSKRQFIIEFKLFFLLPCRFITNSLSSKFSIKWSNGGLIPHMVSFCSEKFNVFLLQKCSLFFPNTNFLQLKNGLTYESSDLFFFVLVIDKLNGLKEKIRHFTFER